MKILKVYIHKNIGETTELEIEVDNNITEDEAEEIARDEFFKTNPLFDEDKEK